MAFIVFEGLDGAGKSTLISGLADQLQSYGIPFVLTREPGGTEFGEEIRSLLLRTSGDPPCGRCELLLYEAIRAQNVDRKIRPALHQGQWVLCDRYSASTTAFQGGGRQLDEPTIHCLNQYATDGCEPDLWVFLDLTTQEAFQRKEGHCQGHRDRFEREDRDFHERVRQKYLELSHGQSHWLRLDAKLPPEKLQKELMDQLEDRGFLEPRK